MKTKLMKSAFVAAIAIVAGINVLNAQKDVAYDRVFLTKS